MAYYSTRDNINISYRTVGNPAGIPFVFLHGGPGLGCTAADEAFFDLDRHFVVFIDQRGAPASHFSAELTLLERLDLVRPALMVEDINEILKILGLKKVHLFGGSWGATLALLYAIQYPEQVSGMTLRGTFMGTHHHMYAILDYGRGQQVWKELMKDLPEDSSNEEVVQHYYEKLLHGSIEDQLIFARRWLNYNGALLGLNQVDDISAHLLWKTQLLLHFIVNDSYLEEGFIVKNAERIGSIPVTFIHGTRDYLCPIEDVKEFVSVCERAELIEVDAIHFATEPLIKEALLNAIKLVV